MTPELNNIQDAFLNQLRKDREQIQITTTNGFRIKCRIKGFDRFSILVESGEFEQLIFKHAVASISVKRGFSNKIKMSPGESDDAGEKESEEN